MNTMSGAARSVLLIGAGVGLVLAFLFQDWLGDFSDHCDYPDECLGTYASAQEGPETSWFTHALEVVQYTWAVAIVVAGIGILLAAFARWPRRDLLVLGACWLAIVASIAIVPPHLTGEALTAAQIQDHRYLWDSPVNDLVALLAGSASIVLGWIAARTPAPSTTHAQAGLSAR